MKLFPGNKKKALTLSYDDDTVFDIRFAELIRNHGFRCTFNLNGDLFCGDENASGKRQMTVKEAQTKLDTDINEIATHGFTHPHYELLTAEEVDADIKRDIASLSEIFSRKVNGHAYPFGTYTPQVKKILSDNGIIYARTVRSTHKFELPTDFMEWNPTCHQRDERLFELLDEFLAYDGDEPKLFYMWGHTHEFDYYDCWDLIEKFVEAAGGADDVWYCTNGEYYEWAKNNL